MLYNAKSLSFNENTIDEIAIDDYSGYTNKQQLINMKNKVNKMKVTDTGGLPYILKLLVDMPYIITTNIDTDDSTVNGALGI